jgi:hypothetical protein
MTCGDRPKRALSQILGLFATDSGCRAPNALSNRAVYTVQYPEAVFVLDCFEKKSTYEIKTPQHIIDRIKARLKHVGTSRQRKRLL